MYSRLSVASPARAWTVSFASRVKRDNKTAEAVMQLPGAFPSVFLSPAGEAALKVIGADYNSIWEFFPPINFDFSRNKHFSGHQPSREVTALPKGLGAPGTGQVPAVLGKSPFGTERMGTALEKLSSSPWYPMPALNQPALCPQDLQRCFVQIAVE